MSTQSQEGASSPRSNFGGLTTAAAAPRGRVFHPLLGLAVLLTGNFVTILDLFIVNVALESIQRNLHATLAEMQLVVVAYSVAYGVSLMNGARLGDLYGRRRIFLVGIALFTGASALCGLAPTPWVLIGARALQGTGAALLMPQVFASIRVLFEGDSRRRAFGIMGAVQGVAASISQIAGGYLIEHGIWHLGWRLVFLVNVPVGLVALVAGRALITETRAQVVNRLDLRGAVTGTLGLLLLLVSLMEGRQYGWPWWSFAGPVLALFVFVGFVRYEKRLSARGGVPIIEMSLFRNGHFVSGIAGIFLFYSAISSFFLSLTMLLQFGLGLSPLVAGEIFTPAAVAFFAGALAAPRIAAKLGHRALLVGVLLFASGLAVSIVVGVTDPRQHAAADRVACPEWSRTGNGHSARPLHDLEQRRRSAGGDGFGRGQHDAACRHIGRRHHRRHPVLFADRFGVG